MKLTLPILLLLFLAPCMVSADVIISEDFDTGPVSYVQQGSVNVNGTSVPITSTGPLGIPDNTLSNGLGTEEDYFGIVNNTVVESTYTNVSGNFYGAQNTSGDTNSQPDEVRLDFAGINISNFQNLTFEGLFASFDNPTNGLGQWDPNTSVQVQAQIDGSAINVLAFESINNSVDDRSVRQDLDFSGDGDLPPPGGPNTLLGDDFRLFSANIAGTGNILNLSIIISNLNSEGEDIAFDNITINGDEIQAVPEPASLLLFGSALGVCVLPRRRKSLFSFLSKS